MLSHAGFTNITHIELKVPIGLWPADKKQKEIGAYLLLSVESGFEAFGMKLFTGVWDMTESEAKIFCAEVLRSAKDRKIHGYSLQWVSLFSFCFFCVRKETNLNYKVIYIMHRSRWGRGKIRNGGGG